MRVTHLPCITCVLPCTILAAQLLISRDGHCTITDMAIDKPSHYGHGHTCIHTIGIWSTTSMVSMVNNMVMTAMCIAMYSQSK